MHVEWTLDHIFFSATYNSGYWDGGVAFPLHPPLGQSLLFYGMDTGQGIISTSKDRDEHIGGGAPTL